MCLARRHLSTLATRAADLADALYAQGRFDEAWGCTQASQRHSAQDDLSAQIAWRSVHAKVLAQQGDADEAEAIGVDALRIAEETDALNQRAKTELDLAEVLRIAGKDERARAHANTALRLYELKRNTAGQDKARAAVELAALA